MQGTASKHSMFENLFGAKLTIGANSLGWFSSGGFCFGLGRSFDQIARAFAAEFSVERHAGWPVTYMKALSSSLGQC